jgi:hypothetical protein
MRSKRKSLVRQDLSQKDMSQKGAVFAREGVERRSYESTLTACGDSSRCDSHDRFAIVSRDGTSG